MKCSHCNKKSTQSEFHVRAKTFPTQVSLVFELVNQICQVKQLKTVWFESDFCVILHAFATLLTVDNGQNFTNVNLKLN